MAAITVSTLSDFFAAQTVRNEALVAQRRAIDAQLRDMAWGIRYYRDRPIIRLTVEDGARHERNRDYGSINVKLDVEWYSDEAAPQLEWRVEAEWVVQSHFGILHGALAPKGDCRVRFFVDGNCRDLEGSDFVRAALEVASERALMTAAMNSPGQWI